MFKKTDPEKIGLKIVPDFISASEERAILSKIERSQKRNTSERNSIKRFGSANPYGGHFVSSFIPDYLDSISEKLVSEGLLEQKPDSLTINEYLIGQYIPFHIDSPKSGPVISILGVLGPATMKFSLPPHSNFKIQFPPRCLIQLKDEIRYKWLHCIEPVKCSRYSIVFRCSS